MTNQCDALAINPDNDAVDTEAVLNAKHLRLLERLRGLLEKKGKRLKSSQERLARLFLATEGHSRLDALLDALRADFPNAPMSLVKTTMNLLVETGVARSFQAGEELVFEHGHLSDHHDHLVCVKCGTIREFYDETIEEHQDQAARRDGFQPFFHRLTIHGLCAECFRSTPSFMPLSASKVGDRVRIETIDGDREMVRHLAAMGLARGAEAKVVGGENSMSLEVRGSRVAVGADMAEKIMVAPLPRMGDFSS